MTSISTATSSIQHLLKDDAGFLWWKHVSHNHLSQITKTFRDLKPEQRNEVVASLNDCELQKWVSEIGAARWLCYSDVTGGLDGGEKQELFSMLLGSLKPDQRLRLTKAMGAEDPEMALAEYTSVLKQSSGELFSLTNQLLNEDGNANFSEYRDALLNNMLSESKADGAVYTREAPSYVLGFESPTIPEEFKDTDQFKNKSEMEYQQSNALFATQIDGQWVVQIQNYGDPALIDVGQYGNDPNNTQIKIRYGEQCLTLDHADNLKIFGTNKKQNFYVENSVKANLWIDMQGGDDSVINQSRGNTQIIGGQGNDVFYGGEGNSSFSDQSGSNFFASGKGNTSIVAGGDHDTISAVEGNSNITVNDNPSNPELLTTASIYAGDKVPVINNNQADITLYHSGEEPAINGSGLSTTESLSKRSSELGSSITIEGSQFFKKRVEADLALLRASPDGRKMLAELDKAARIKHHGVTIRDVDARITNSFARPYDPQDWGKAFLQADGVPGEGTSALVGYNPYVSDSAQHIPPPYIALFHELSHAYNIVNGTMQPLDELKLTPKGRNLTTGEVGQNAEPQVMGAENTGFIYDVDGEGPEEPSTHNPIDLTETGISTEGGSYVRLRHDGQA